jgi:hypothetical protein
MVVNKELNEILENLKLLSLKKNKKIGRVKRKIFKKINIINNIVD